MDTNALPEVIILTVSKGMYGKNYRQLKKWLNQIAPADITFIIIISIGCLAYVLSKLIDKI